MLAWARWLFLLSLPLQLGRHFWWSGSYLWGLPVDYLAPVFYLSDLFFLIWLLVSLRQRRPPAKAVIFWLVLAAVNIFFSQNKAISFWAWLRFCQLPLLVWLVGQQKKAVVRILPTAIVFWLVLEAILVLGEFSHQASLGFSHQVSLGSWAWWLGERRFSLATPGIAKIHAGGRLWLRPYGTFPHPNALAGFALVAVLLLWATTKKLAARLWGSILAGLVIFLTASRLIWFLAGLVFLGLSPWPALAVLPLGLVFVLPPPLSSWQRRWQLFQAAIKMWRRHWLFGVGLGNFLPQLSRFWPGDWGHFWLQPVHNAYLLWFSQTGLWGIGPFLHRFWGGNRFWHWAGLAIGLSALADHYWLTSQQNFLLLAIWLGLANAGKNRRKCGD